MNEFIIKQKLPSLNDVLRHNRSNKYKGNRFKKEVEEVICWAIRQAQAARRLYKPSGPVVVKISWFEKTKKRDADNIQSSAKFILDALVKSGILEDDSRKYVKQIQHEIIDDKKDSVKVELIEL